VSLHRAADGSLAGLGVCLLALGGLTLYWQNQWGRSFQKLEAAQVLEHRLQESAALLERHHLRSAGKPGVLMPTSSDKLIFVSPPRPRPTRAAGTFAALSWDEPVAGY
jgi:hypothetical protein